MPSLKYADGFLPTCVVFLYLVVAYPLSIWLLVDGPLWALGIVLLAHSLVVAAYWLHDCMHNAVFISPAHNTVLGKALAFLVGASVSPYEQLREKHFRHHVERTDILAVNYSAFLQRYPAVNRLVKCACTCCLPAVELLLKGLEIAAPFIFGYARISKTRVLLVLSVRALLLAGLFVLNPLAPLFYGLAYGLFLMVMAFMDAFQHSYNVRYELADPQQSSHYDREYEEANTYTNLISARQPWLNLLVLNFCYHNVHHHKPNEPWYRLPAHHDEAYPQGCHQLVGFFLQVKQFFKHRVSRIHHPDNQQLTGADGVSFMVGV